MRTIRVVLAGLMIVWAFAGPAAAENVLRWASAGGAVTFDPHAYEAGPNFAICEAVATQLKDVGIDVTVNAQPFEIHLNKIDSKESDFWMDSVSPFPGGSPYVFAQFYNSRGPWNSTGYANAAVDELIGEAQAALITYARDALIEEIWRLVLDDIVYLPLHHQMVTWAMRDQLDLPVDPWNFPRFHMAQIK